MRANELQKLRDKLEQARDISVISDSCRDCYMIDTKNELINQALASLQADPCKRCGGSKQVWKCDKIGKAHPVGDDCIKIPCPDCNCKKIELTGGKYTLVDAEDYERVNKYKWRLDENGRAARNKNNKEGQRNIKMHRFIMNTPLGMCTDHVNYDTLDNRKSNLRICTPAQSSAHRKAIPNTSSKYKGVTWRPNRNKWYAQIKHNYKGIHLGSYDTEEEAARAYDKKAKEFFGEYAELNFDCKAEPGEILKEARVLLKAGANEEQWAFATKLREVLVLIDRQQKELAAKDKRIEELEEIEKSARNLYDNRLGWSDGRNPYAPPEFWNNLKQALMKGGG